MTEATTVGGLVAYVIGLSVVIERLVEIIWSMVMDWHSPMVSWKPERFLIGAETLLPKPRLGEDDYEDRLSAYKQQRAMISIRQSLAKDCAVLPLAVGIGYAIAYGTNAADVVPFNIGNEKAAALAGAMAGFLAPYAHQTISIAFKASKTLGNVIEKTTDGDGADASPSRRPVSFRAMPPPVHTAVTLQPLAVSPAANTSLLAAEQTPAATPAHQ